MNRDERELIKNRLQAWWCSHAPSNEISQGAFADSVFDAIAPVIPENPGDGADEERKRLMEILLAEFAYWREEDSREHRMCDETETAAAVYDGISIGATSSIANVIAAMCGSLAPWHKTKR